MKDEDLLVPLDYSKLEGLENIGPEFSTSPFDPGNKFSILTSWGTLGNCLQWNHGDEAPEHWWPLEAVSMRTLSYAFDGAWGSGPGLNSLGYSLNSKNTLLVLEETVDKLYKLTPNIKAIVADDEGLHDSGLMLLSAWPSWWSQPNARKKRKSTLCGTDWGQQPWFDKILAPKQPKPRCSLMPYQLYVLKPENALKNVEYVG